MFKNLCNYEYNVSSNREMLIKENFKLFIKLQIYSYKNYTLKLFYKY